LGIDALGQKVGVGEVAAAIDGGALTVENEAQGIHEGGFAATVEAPNQDDGAVGLRSQINAVMPMVGTKVLQY
jgi:hypothetical protein